MPANKSKKTSLTEKEQALLTSYEAGEWQSDTETVEQLVKAARLSMRKTRRINIRLSESTLLKVKQRALEEGIPYQTLIGSILHKYVQGKLKSA